ARHRPGGRRVRRSGRHVRRTHCRTGRRSQAAGGAAASPHQGTTRRDARNAARLSRRLMRYILRRVLHACAALLLVSALVFVFTELAPGNFFDEMRLNPQISPDSVAGLKAKYGLEQPLPARYGTWLASVFRGEF